MEEKGTLLLGVEHGGAIYKKFTIGVSKVKHTVDALEKYPRALENDRFLGICLLTGQISIEGVPKEEITPDTLMEMASVDMAIITAANERLKKKIARFRTEDASAQGADADGSEIRISSGGDPEDERGAASGLVDDQLSTHEDPASEWEKNQNLQGSQER